MTGRIQILGFLLLLFIVPIQTRAQQFKAFSEEPQLYLEEMDALFARSTMHYSEGNELLDRFEPLWLAASEEQQKDIIEISNLMLKRRARNFPHFFDYLETLYAFKTLNFDTLSYANWEKGLQLLLADRKVKLNDISNYINAGLYLVKENAIYYSPTVKWFADNKDYTIVVDNDTAKIVFDKVELTCKLRNDSIQILSTSGYYNIIEKVWHGDKAVIDWQRHGIDAKDTWAEVGAYAIDVTKATYSLPEVQFYHQVYFTEPIVGSLTDKVVELRNKRLASYPRFVSAQKAFQIEGFEKDIDYEGGFTMKGPKFLGTGTNNEKASVTIWRDVELIDSIKGDTVIKKEIFMQSRSQVFSLTEDEILSSNAEISMYIDKDSIYHPGLMFNYTDKTRTIELVREESAENKSKSPYYNSYHKIEMDFEYLTWQMDEQQVNLTMLKGTAINTARFESNDYFSAERYYEFQGLEETHPYVLLRRYAMQYDTDIIHAHDFAKFARLPLAPVHNLFIELSYNGILNYDTENQIASLNPKLYKYLDAKVGRVDYDLIIFDSETQAPESNAVLNLRNMDLEIQGVPEINLSEKQNVVFYPKNQQILFKKDRDFDFSGKIQAGLFTFYGDNFAFKYDSFKVDMEKIDSMSMEVDAGVDEWGLRVTSSVGNVIEDISGNLQIDDPNNKSGVQDFPDYPKFESTKKSYVYYDDHNIQDGKYIRDRFYFVINPYTIDSLNTFQTQGMGYEGELYSADIFPVIPERLMVQPDNSLGFVHQTDEQGLPAYKGKGHYYKEINLSNRGLRGEGELSYLTSVSQSDDFIFYPDSTNAFTQGFLIEKQLSSVQYPDVMGQDGYIHWMPYEDELMARSEGEPMHMYDGRSKHFGSLLYSPLGLTGEGRMRYFNSDLSSQGFSFLANRANADTANFVLDSEVSDTLAFATQNVSAKVDFEALKSTFRAIEGSTQATLATNLYDVYLERFSWLMGEKKMQLETPNTAQVYEFGKVREVSRQEAGLAPKGSLFISIHKGQDSLSWVSPLADFDLTTSVISAHQVKYINVADARVFPFEEEVVIQRQAKMNSLLDARLLANTDTKYHDFKDATINIVSRKQYSGEGVYNYEDQMGQIKSINFYVIAVDSLGHTFAKGKITGMEDFSLSTAFKFQGEVELYAPNKFLTYNGSAKMNHNCEAQLEERWIKFKDEINPSDIYIPIAQQPQDINDNYLLSGPIVATDSVHLFPSFLSPWKAYSNVPVQTADGYLYYDQKSKYYKLGSKARINSDDTTGNIVMLHKNFCNLYGDGDINLTVKLGQVKVETKGNSNYKLEEDELKLEALTTIDFYLPPDCFTYISDTLGGMTGLKSINLRSGSYQKGLKELLGSAEANAFIKEQSIFGTVKQLPDALRKTFVFPDLKLHWNHDVRAWQYVGPLDVASVFGVQINKQVTGAIEFDRKRSGDSFTLYLELAEGHWYYFAYKRGLMQAYSSEEGFNTIIHETKQKDRKLKVERGEMSYVFFVSNLKARNEFLEHMGLEIGME